MCRRLKGMASRLHWTLTAAEHVYVVPRLDTMTSFPWAGLTFDCGCDPLQCAMIRIPVTPRLLDTTAAARFGRCFVFHVSTTDWRRRWSCRRLYIYKIYATQSCVQPHDTVLGATQPWIQHPASSIRLEYRQSGGRQIRGGVCISVWGIICREKAWGDE